MNPEITMRGPLAWFAKNHVAANLLMVALMFLGTVLALNSKVNVFPDIDPRTVTVSVVYPGATPEEVEEGISRRVEEAVTGIEGIKRVRSTSSEGRGVVSLELEDDADKNKVLDDVKSAVDGIQNFPPQDAETPTVQDAIQLRKVLTVALWGEASERTLRELAFRLRDDLSSLDGISLVSVEGVRDYEIGVEVSERALRTYGLTFAEVAAAVRGYSVNLPAGSIRTDRGEILLRTSAQAYDGLDFERLVVRTQPDGTIVRLGDVAEIVDGFADVDTASHFNGHPAAYVSVRSVGKQQVLDIEQKVKGFAQSWPTPEGVQTSIWGNRADDLRGRIDLLLRNGLMGLVLVFFVLVLFLDLRLAFWTTMGIPISFLGAFLFITMAGASIDMISLFAFILVLGIVVDDAIVVGENIFAKREEGLEHETAAIAGLREVVSPVSMGVFTTILAFLPLYFSEGFIGDILWVVPVVVISVLLLSLIESFLILPAHLSGGSIRRKPGALVWIQDRLRHGLHRLVERVYRPTLRLVMQFRYVTLALAVVICMLTVGAIRGGHVKVVFFPVIESDEITARLQMVGGASAAQTQAVLDRMVETAEATRAELDATLPEGEASLFRNVAATLGAQPFGRGGGPNAATGATGSGAAEVAIELSPAETRSVRAAQIVENWRARIGELPGVRTIAFRSSRLSAGDDVSVELAHADFEKLLAATEQVKLYLAEFGGVNEIEDSFESGKRELNFELTEAGLAAGLTRETLARQVRQAYYGEQAQRVQRGRDDIKVLVRYTEAERRNLASLDQLRLRTPQGLEMPLATVANITEGRGYAAIERTDRRRIVRVTADVDEDEADMGRINQQLKEDFLPRLAQELPGLAYSFEGTERERMESLQSLGRGLIIALFGIFALIAVQLKSYTKPFIILSVIPLGFVGAVMAHKLLGYDVSFFSMFGVVALTGVVINDALVFLDLVNRKRDEGLSAPEALLHAGSRRFRPILFTSLTTCVGLAPMVFEKSMQAQFLIPMAISLAGGVAFATLITLVLVPALVLVREDLLFLVRRVTSWVTPGEAATPQTEQS